MAARAEERKLKTYTHTELRTLKKREKVAAAIKDMKLKDARKWIRQNPSIKETFRYVANKAISTLTKAEIARAVDTVLLQPSFVDLAYQELFERKGAEEMAAGEVKSLFRPERYLEKKETEVETEEARVENLLAIMNKAAQREDHELLNLWTSYLARGANVTIQVAMPVAAHYPSMSLVRQDASVLRVIDTKKEGEKLLHVRLLGDIRWVSGDGRRIARSGDELVFVWRERRWWYPRTQFFLDACVLWPESLRNQWLSAFEAGSKVILKQEKELGDYTYVAGEVTQIDLSVPQDPKLDVKVKIEGKWEILEFRKEAMVRHCYAPLMVASWTERKRVQERGGKYRIAELRTLFELIYTPNTSTQLLRVLPSLTGTPQLTKIIEAFLPAAFQVTYLPLEEEKKEKTTSPSK